MHLCRVRERIDDVLRKRFQVALDMRLCARNDVVALRRELPDGLEEGGVVVRETLRAFCLQRHQRCLGLRPQRWLHTDLVIDAVLAHLRHLGANRRRNLVVPNVSVHLKLTSVAGLQQKLPREAL